MPGGGEFAGAGVPRRGVASRFLSTARKGRMSSTWTEMITWIMWDVGAGHFGHANPKIVEAVRSAAEQGPASEFPTR